VFKRTMSFCFKFLLLFNAILFAQVTARSVKLTIVDSDNKPIERAKITVTSPEIRDFKKEFITDKMGQSRFLLPIQIKKADFFLEKEGYQNHQESVELKKMRNLRESFNYEVFFILYRNNEFNPKQEAQRNERYQLALSFFNKGIEFFNSKNYPEAADQFEKAVEAKPDFLEAYENLATSYFQTELYKEAIQAAKKALAISSDSSNIIKLISIAYSKLGEEESALDYMNKLRELPDEQLSAEDLYNIAIQAANHGNDTEALEYFERSIKHSYDFALAHYQLGLCHYRLNNMEAAKKELEAYLTFESEGEKANIAKSLLKDINKKI